MNSVNGTRHFQLLGTLEVMDVEAEKSCRDCHTQTTPTWRSGPDGPRSLCNACGLRFRKKRRGLQGLENAGAEKRRKIGTKLKEEEEAAILLMALSSASVPTQQD